LDGTFYGNSKNKKQVKTFDVITAIDFGTSKYKKRTLTVTGGIVTGVGDESDWWNSTTI
jgi:hypothetical protein